LFLVLDRRAVQPVTKASPRDFAKCGLPRGMLVWTAHDEQEPLESSVVDGGDGRINTRSSTRAIRSSTQTAVRSLHFHHSLQGSVLDTSVTFHTDDMGKAIAKRHEGMDPFPLMLIARNIWDVPMLEEKSWLELRARLRQVD
jgi:hypothetical protein